MYKRLKKALKFLKLGDAYKYKTSGTLTIVSDFDPDLFAMELMIDDQMSTYLYINEGQTPQFCKDRFGVFYKTFEDVDKHIAGKFSFNITQEILTGKRYEDLTTGRTKLKKGDSLLHLKINSTNCSELLEYYQSSVLRLFTYYNTLINRVDEETEETDISVLEKIIPQLTEERTKYMKKERTGDSSYINYLREMVPGMFPGSYTRSCQKEIQKIELIAPSMVIHSSETEYKKKWKDVYFVVDKDGEIEMFINKSEELEPKQAMRYPKDSEFWFASYSESFPYPSLKVSKNIDGSSIYQYIPCTSNVDVSQPGCKSIYREYFYGDEIDKKSTKYVYGTLRSLQDGMTGTIEDTNLQNISIILNTAMEKRKTFLRYGVGNGNSPNSLIHCVLTATKNKEYMEADMKKQEEIAKSYRKKFLKHCILEVAKQELYDYDVGEIKKMLLNLDMYFNPSLFYRLIEEYFEVNIYIFKLHENDATLDIPRNYFVHIRNMNIDRKTIVLLKNTGGTTAMIQHPCCELIGYTNSNDKNVFLFKNSVQECLYNCMIKLQQNYCFNMVEKSIDIHYNLFFDTTYSEFYPEEPVSQYIDGYGKMRILVFEDFSIMFPPMQPLNLKTISDGELVTSTVEKTISIFGMPTGCTDNGLWYQYKDFKFGVFVFTTDVPNSDDFDVGPKISMSKSMSREISGVDIIKQQRKNADYIQQLLIWLLTISYNESPKRAVKKLVKQFRVITDYDHSTYVFDDIPYYLPTFDTLSEAISFLHEHIPTFSDG